MRRIEYSELMVTPPDVRFTRALQKRNERLKQRIGSQQEVEWNKLTLDEEQHALLLQVQEVQGTIFSHSFKDNSPQFHVDFIDINTLGAWVFVDSEEEPIVFVALTPALVGYLLEISKRIVASAQVSAVLGIEESLSNEEDLDESIFLIALQFIITHEVGHYTNGHIGGNTLWFEFSAEQAKTRENVLASHADELEADFYGISELSFNMFEGSFREVLPQRSPPHGEYREEELAQLIAIALTGVMLLYLHRYRDEALRLSSTHPPIRMRLEELLNQLAVSMEKTGKNPAAIKDENRRALVRAVLSALPEEISARWQRQVDFMLEPSTAKYVEELQDFRVARVAARDAAAQQ